MRVAFYVLRSANNNTAPKLINGLKIDHNRYRKRVTINDSRPLCLDRNWFFVQPLPNKETQSASPTKIINNEILTRMYVGMNIKLLVVMHCFKQTGKCRKILVKTPEKGKGSPFTDY